MTSTMPATRLLTVQRALDVLNIVASQPERLQVRAVAHLLAHNLSSTYHIVNTLLEAGYLGRRSDGSLTIGHTIGTLNAARVAEQHLVDVAKPFVEALAQKTGETVYLTRFTGLAAVIELVVESRHSLRVSGLAVGYSGNEDRRASGRAILAHLTDDQVVATVSQLARHQDAQRLRARITRAQDAIAVVRSVGYALDDEEFEQGVTCVAGAYFSPAGIVAGSVALSAPSSRLVSSTVQISLAVTHTAELISAALRAGENITLR